MNSQIYVHNITLLIFAWFGFNSDDANILSEQFKCFQTKKSVLNWMSFNYIC